MRSTGVIAASFGAGCVGLQLLGRRALSTAEERSAVLPSDDMVRSPQLLSDHSGADVAANGPEHQVALPAAPCCASTACAAAYV
jgi:hypothetical protein